MYRVFGFLTKRDGLSMPEFKDYYENHHVPLLLSRAPKPLIHKRRYVNRDEEFMKTGLQVDFEVMVEVAFADEDAFLAYGEALRAGGRSTTLSRSTKPSSSTALGREHTSSTST